MSENNSAETTDAAIITEKPSQVNRQDLIDTAVRFLNNPKVKPTQREHKRLFLSKKGLTESEIDTALKLCSDSNDSQPSEKQQSPTNFGFNNNNSEINSLVTKTVVKPKPSLWLTVFKWIRNFILAGCFAFTAYKFLIKKYFFNNNKLKSKKSVEKVLEEKNEELKKSIDEIRNSIDLLRVSVETMNSNIKNTPKNSLNIEETGLKSEFQSIKNLLLNRNQFPSLPVTTPVLPSWQLESNKARKVKDEKLNGNDLLNESAINEDENASAELEKP